MSKQSERRRTRYEMGWNDALGNIRMQRLFVRQEFAAKLLKAAKADKRTDRHYAKGVVDLATAFVACEEVAYKGPDWVIACLEDKEKESDRLREAKKRA